MKICIADTETTGLFKYGPGIESDAPGQPHMLSLGIHTFDDEDPAGAEITGLQYLIKPEGWTIDERLIGDDGKPTAFSVNGISNERAMDEGRPLREVMDWFLGEALPAVDEHGFYNSSFDSKVLRASCVRAYGRQNFPYPHIFAHPRFCVMRSVSPFTKLPPTEKMLRHNMTWSKQPKLVEAHIWATGEAFDGAHGALADCRAAGVVYRHVLATEGRAAIVHVPVKDFQR